MSNTSPFEGEEGNDGGGHIKYIRGEHFLELMTDLNQRLESLSDF